MRIITILTLLIFLTACKEEAPKMPKKPKIERTLKVACIGDQIMTGKGTKNPETEAYPVQLQGLLGDDYIVKTFIVKNGTVLKNGSTPYWEDTTFQKAQDFEPDIVVIHLGSNDTKMHNWWKYGDEFASDYAAMAQTFMSLENKPRVLLCRPVRPHDIVRGINDSTMVIGVLPAIDSVAKQQRLERINLYELLAFRDDLFGKGLHPNRTACRIIANKIADTIISDSWKGN